MRLPRDMSGAELATRLGVLGYAVTRQTGSHMGRRQRATVNTISPSPPMTRSASVR
jgi:predicted RNA binding protein YcfA (HicA-like mRNA interferase family)